MPRLVLDDVAVAYGTTPRVDALRSVSAEVDQGDFIAIEGPSGGGKSTLLNVLGLLHEPTGGRYLIGDVDAAALGPRDAARMRSTVFAFVFQNFHLLDRRPAIDSVELGMLYQGLSSRERRQRALTALDQVGLAGYDRRPAGTLSGGERQRVAIARALATRAQVVLADEPTGNLDTANEAAVMAALSTVNAQGVTVIVVTHDEAVARHARHRLQIRDGRRVGPADPSDHDQAQASRVDLGDWRRGSRLRPLDLIRDGVASVRSRRARSAGLALAVAVATGLAVTTTGLSSSAAAQVATTFDANENTLVTATVRGVPDDRTTVTGWQPPDPVQQRERATRIAGVDNVLVVQTLGTQSLASAPWREPGQGEVVRVGDGMATVNPTVTWADGARGGVEDAPAAGEALVGVNVAANIELGPLAASPVVLVDGIAFLVAGIVQDGGQLPALTGSVVIGPQEQDGRYVVATTVLARTATGAAQQVASQIGVAVSPTEPDAVTVVAPVDPRTLRGAIESDLRLALLALTGAAVLAAVVSLANSMVAAVQERRGEFGLRRAVGAGGRHIVALVMVEAGVIATVGAVLGLLAGVYGVLGVTIARSWTPVFDLRVVPVALVGGLVVGLLGGAFAARQAARIQPDQALRE